MTTAEVAVPDMLILGRESRGLSQEALAATSGVSQAYISKGENALIEVTGECFEALAEALGYPIEFFLQHEHAAGVDALFQALRSFEWIHCSGGSMVRRVQQR